VWTTLFLMWYLTVQYPHQLLWSVWINCKVFKVKFFSLFYLNMNRTLFFNKLQNIVLCRDWYSWGVLLLTMPAIKKKCMVFSLLKKRGRRDGGGEEPRVVVLLRVVACCVSNRTIFCLFELLKVDRQLPLQLQDFSLVYARYLCRNFLSTFCISSSS
jgi:hypothetical protein